MDVSRKVHKLRLQLKVPAFWKGRSFTRRRLQWKYIAKNFLEFLLVSKNPNCVNNTNTYIDISLLETIFSAKSLHLKQRGLIVIIFCKL